LRTFSRLLVRRLVERWRLDQSLNTDVVVEQIVSRFRLLSIPITPVNITIFLTVVETVRGFTPINTSSLIEDLFNLSEKYFKNKLLDQRPQERCCDLKRITKLRSTIREHYKK